MAWRMRANERPTIGQKPNTRSCAGYVDQSTVNGKSRPKGKPTIVKRHRRR